MLHKEIIQGKINEARMGAKDLASVKIPNDATFGFEFEIAANENEWGIFSEDDLRERAIETAHDEITEQSVFENMDLEERLQTFKDLDVEPIFGWVSHDEVSNWVITKNRENVKKVLELPENTSEERKQKLAWVRFYRIVNITVKNVQQEDILSNLTQVDDNKVKQYLKVEIPNLKLDYYLNPEIPTGIFWADEDKDEQYDLEDISYGEIEDYFDGFDEGEFWELVVDDKINERVEELIEEYMEEGETEGAQENIIDHFAEGLGGVVSYEYHDEEKSYTEFVVEPDTSISPFGCEIVSPIYYSWEEAKDGLHQVLNMIQKEDVFTNESTGLHCNIGGPFLKDIDWVKFFVFFDDSTMLKQWGRSHNTYAKQYLKNISSGFFDMPELSFQDGKEKPDFNATKKRINDTFLKDAEKYRSINLSKLSNGYVEMRVAGGANYEYKEKEIIQLIQKFLRAAAISIDPNAYKNELFKKLYQLWDGEKQFKNTYGTDGQIAQKVKKFLDKLKPNRVPSTGRAYTSLYGLIFEIFVGEMVDFFKDPKIRREFREIVKELPPIDEKGLVTITRLIKSEKEFGNDIKSYFLSLINSQ